MKEGTENKRDWKNLPFYSRVTIAGLLVFALFYTGLTILFMVSGGVGGIEDAVQTIVFYALFTIPTLAIVIQRWRRPREWPLLAPTWAILMLLIIAPLIPNAFGTFNSFFDIGLLIPTIVSLILVGVAGIVELLHHRRNTARDVSTAGERWVLRATVAIVIGLMVASGTLHLNSLESVDPGEKAAALSVDMENSTFMPAQLTVPAGKPAKFFIKNNDLTVHTFTIQELGIDVKVLPGSEELFELSSPPAGTYVYICTFGIGFSLPLHRPEVESDPSKPSDSGTLLVSAP